MPLTNAEKQAAFRQRRRERSREVRVAVAEVWRLWRLADANSDHRPALSGAVRRLAELFELDWETALYPGQ